ncbi:hypothetical protein Pla86_45450 [Planctomycetes bacterium Pla86]|uniref:Uncharacterized protein n=2 Tax=Engelhardtia mirabilis TaxID=2528011 RepID=A0A518BR15_9BACT|nr:hypothetical protein Pla133_45470 [Planctomycetes bacterium Pla133]QDV03753.1 hypothetical protein Pla86_45450 [Planctomycetes bacterium Pla86]
MLGEADNWQLVGSLGDELILIEQWREVGSRLLAIVPGADRPRVRIVAFAAEGLSNACIADGRIVARVDMASTKNPAFRVYSADGSHQREFEAPSARFFQWQGGESNRYASFWLWSAVMPSRRVLFDPREGRLLDPMTFEEPRFEIDYWVREPRKSFEAGLLARRGAGDREGAPVLSSFDLGSPYWRLWTALGGTVQWLEPCRPVGPIDESLGTLAQRLAELDLIPTEDAAAWIARE